MKQYPPNWHGDLTLATIDMVANLLRSVLADETFTTVEVGRLDRPQVETRQYLSTAISFHDIPIFVFKDNHVGRLTISTAQQNWSFQTGDTQIVYDRGREIYFKSNPFGIQVIFKLDENASDQNAPF